jgi:hypothetical protein
VVKLVAFLGSIIALVLSIAGVATAQTYPAPGVTSIVPPNPTPGSPVTISGNCAPGDTVSVVLLDGSDAAALTASAEVATVDLAAVRTLGTTTADPSGAFSLTVSIPTDVTPPAVLQVTGSACGTLATVSVLSQVTQPTSAPTTTPAGGGLVSTGSNADVLFPLAIALVVAGGLIVLTVRQRRRRRVPTSV